MGLKAIFIPVENWGEGWSLHVNVKCCLKTKHGFVWLLAENYLRGNLRYEGDSLKSLFTLSQEHGLHKPLKEGMYAEKKLWRNNYFCTTESHWRNRLSMPQSTFIRKGLIVWMKSFVTEKWVWFVNKKEDSYLVLLLVQRAKQLGFLFYPLYFLAFPPFPFSFLIFVIFSELE